MTRLLLLIAWFGCIATPVEAQWTYHGLSGGMLRELQLHDGHLYVANDRGLYRKPAHQADTVWASVGLDGRHVRTFAILGADSMLAVVFRYTDGQVEGQDVLRTLDGGVTWERVAVDVEQDDPEELFKVVRRFPDEAGVLLAGGFHAMWKSEDLGRTWRRTASASDVHFLGFDPLRPEMVWSGGESNIHWPYVLKSSDAGETWQWMQLDLGGDNAVYTLAIDPVNSDVLYVGTEGGILKSSNAGTTWEGLLQRDFCEYFYGVSISPIKPARIYAAGICSPPATRPLTLYVSDNRGDSWSTVEHGEAQEMFGAGSMAVHGGDGVDTVYLGTRHHGVFAYAAPLATHVDPDGTLPRGTQLDQNYPNPFTVSTTIQFNTEAAGHARLRIFDVLGREVARPLDQPLPAGVHHVKWRADALSAGTYLYRLEMGAFRDTRTMLLLD